MIDQAPDDAINPTDAFRLPEEGEYDPRPILGRLIDDCPEFRHLRVGEATIMVLIRSTQKVKANKAVLGEIALPRFMGNLAALASWMLAMMTGGAIPDFILILDQGFWRDVATPKQREALIYHELCHAIHATDKEGELKFDDDGNPVWGLVGHDIEEFNAVVARYGTVFPDIEAFRDTLRRTGNL